jgi:hypothetical protein
MRTMGFVAKWPKLKCDQFTTFRFARKDKDWSVGEMVNVVVRPRSKYRENLGVAVITEKASRFMAWQSSTLAERRVTKEEAIEDGFGSYYQMWDFLVEMYGKEKLLMEPMNKLTLRWVERGES